MRILYGVVGEGMGHATRSRVILSHLLELGHTIQVVVSGRATGFLRDVFAENPRIQVAEIIGLHLVQDEEGIDRSASLWSNLRSAPRALAHNLATYDRVAAEFRAEAVISDFESWAYFYARTHDIPVVSIDNIQVLHRCRHPLEITETRSFNFLLARYSAKAKLPGAYHFLITSFFTPQVRKARTTLVPPILRPEVLAAKRGQPGDHVLVYQHQTAVRALIPALKELPQQRFVVYGSGYTGSDHNLEFRPFSQVGFVEDLATARGVVAGGGFSLMSEAVHLGTPMLSVPLVDQYEQELNARYLAHLGYGAWARSLTRESLTEFLDKLPGFASSLAGYSPADNAMTTTCVDELLRLIELGESAPSHLESNNLGCSVASATDRALDYAD
jgi:uncharacterized protein (TIGR00661 family)